MRFYIPALFILINAMAVYLPAQNAALNAKHFNLEKGVALAGYDAVSYFSGKPVKGKSNFQAVSDGVKYNFATAANRDAFLKNPNAYKPEFGGWCAYAMGANGEKVEVNPETFKLINGKLYLFYNAFFNNTLNTWNKDEASLKTKAEKNWKSIFK
ncbi:MAG: YHS domain protein [Saprospiraceae bacterium]|nr:YHS domain protein [Saprospiraceae bacterium]